MQSDRHTATPHTRHQREIAEVNSADCETCVQFSFFCDNGETAISATVEQLGTKRECRFVKRPKIIVPIYIILVLRALPIMVARKSFYTIVVPS